MELRDIPDRAEGIRADSMSNDDIFVAMIQQLKQKWDEDWQITESLKAKRRPDVQELERIYALPDERS